MSHHEHKAAAPHSVRCFVLTVSDTRTADTDTSGRAICDLLLAGGHQVASRAIVRDDPAEILRIVTAQVDDSTVDVVLTTGGTGLTSRDGTYEAIVSLLEKTLDGFGELFRMLSFQEIGPAAMMSRAVAGTRRGKVVVALPGSEHAVRLAMSRLLLPELPHLVQQARK